MLTLLQTRPKRTRGARPPKSHPPPRPKQLTYRASKALENNIRPEIQAIITRLQNLGKPFDNDLDEIVSSAGRVLDGQAEVADGVIEQLLQMESDWKAAHEGYRKGMVALLERNGVIPMGSAT